MYRFCFVEKNRIDSFSRIAAQTPAKQTELISTLFGLDAFNGFVHNFTSEINDKYIDLVGIKAKQLAERRQALEGTKQQEKNSIGELQNLVSEEQNLATQYRDGLTFDQMVSEINGNEQELGLIKKLEAELQQPVARRSNLTSIALETLGSFISTSISECSSKKGELKKYSQQVSFKQLL